MAIHEVITTENPILRQKAKKVHRFDPSIAKLIDDMFETMHVAHGVGLAAPQIAISVRIFVAEYEDRKIAMVNPEIIKAEGEDRGTEGCLSIPGYIGENIRVRAEGWLARILQHEIDHLDGILFLDRLDSPEDLREVTEAEYEEAEAEALIE